MKSKVNDMLAIVLGTACMLILTLLLVLLICFLTFVCVPSTSGAPVPQPTARSLRVQEDQIPGKWIGLWNNAQMTMWFYPNGQWQCYLYGPSYKGRWHFTNNILQVHEDNGDVWQARLKFRPQHRHTFPLEYLNMKDRAIVYFRIDSWHPLSDD